MSERVMTVEDDSVTGKKLRLDGIVDMLDQPEQSFCKSLGYKGSNWAMNRLIVL